LADDAVDTMRTRLLPLATVVTPNLPEAARLVGFDVVTHDDAVRAGRALLGTGAGAALIKGGHGHGDVVVDTLVLPDGVVDVRSPRLQTRHTHGTGCTLSAAIAARLGRGDALVDAVQGAVAWVHAGIATAPGIGAGHGPLNHLHGLMALGRVP
jgi:hydroxymethylpyrimidine/phosphomethylpyrimidine kinase